MKVRYALVALLATSIAVGYWLQPRSQKPFASSAVYQVTRGEMNVVLQFRGTLKAVKTHEISGNFPTMSRITYLIPEGTRAHKGQVIARLDDSQIRQQLDRSVERLQEEQQQLQEQQTKIAVEKQDLDKKRGEAKRSLEVAILEHKHYLHGDIPLENTKLALSVEVSEMEWLKRRAKWRHLPELLAKEFITMERLRQEKIALYQAQIELEQARHKQQVFQKYTSVIELQRRQGNLDKKNEEYREFAANSERKIANYQTDLLHHQAELDSIRREVDKSRKDIARFEVKAPFECLVAYGSPERPWMKLFVRVGEYAWSGITLFTLPDLTQMKVAIKLDEIAVSHLREGMVAHVDIAIANKHALPAKIARIPEIAGQQNWLSSGKEFAIDVILDDKNLSLTPGTTALVTIEAVKLTDVLRVPLHAVSREGKERFVYRLVQREQKWQLQKTVIETGKRGVHFIEVKAGLDPGDKIFLGPPAAAKEW